MVGGDGYHARSCTSLCIFSPFLTSSPLFQMGFFADAGPLSIFVTNYLIPADMPFNAEDLSYGSSDAPEGRIRAECRVRLKIIGSSVQQTTLSAIGSVDEPFLGLLSSA